MVNFIQALLATFPETGAVSFTSTEQSVLEASRRQISSSAPASYQSQLSGSVSFLAMQLEGSPIGLHYTLPHDYPDCAPRIQVQCAAGRYTLPHHWSGHEELAVGMLLCMHGRHRTCCCGRHMIAFLFVQDIF